MEDKLNDFLRGSPFEFGFDELQPTREAAKAEALKPIFRLPPLQSESTEPTLEPIKEFAEAARGDTYAFPRKDAAQYVFGSGKTVQLGP